MSEILKKVKTSEALIDQVGLIKLLPQTYLVICLTVTTTFFSTPLLSLKTPLCLGTPSNTCSADPLLAPDDSIRSLISRVSSKRKASCSEKLSGGASAEGCVLRLNA